MAKVALNRGAGRSASDTVSDSSATETPSQRIVSAANKLTVIATDSGMSLSIRQLGAFDEMKLTRAVGAESSNQQFMLWCMMAASIAAIDGDAEPFPQSALECEAIISRIGDDGVIAIQRYAEQRAAERAVAARRNIGGKGANTTDEAEFIDNVKK